MQTLVGFTARSAEPRLAGFGSEEATHLDLFTGCTPRLLVQLEAKKSPSFRRHVGLFLPFPRRGPGKRRQFRRWLFSSETDGRDAEAEQQGECSRLPMHAGRYLPPAPSVRFNLSLGTASAGSAFGRRVEALRMLQRLHEGESCPISAATHCCARCLLLSGCFCCARCSCLLCLEPTEFEVS